MFLISLPNLKEINQSMKMLFSWLKLTLYVSVKKKNINIRKFVETYISQTTKPIFFKFGMLCCVYG